MDNYEEYEFHCENCLGEFTSTSRKNLKCPHCGYVNESLDPIEPDDKEPDWEPTEEEWEDIFDDD